MSTLIYKEYINNTHSSATAYYNGLLYVQQLFIQMKNYSKFKHGHMVSSVYQVNEKNNSVW